MNNFARWMNAALCLLLHLAGQAALPAHRPVPVTHSMPLDSSGLAARYKAEPLFPDISFTDALFLATPPGETNRIFVLEKQGVIKVIPDLANPAAEVFLDFSGQVLSTALTQGATSMAFHPGYATNGYLYVLYTAVTNTAAGVGNHNVLGRFTVSSTNANRAVLSSFMPILADRDLVNYSDTGCMRFGPDGYLYFTIGDEVEGSYNPFRRQHLDRNFFGGMFRIDVDLRPGNLPPNPHPAILGPYRVPADNPFVGATQLNGTPVTPGALRTEFYAIGLRNPWRFDFDPFTGDIACGDVGVGSREEFNFILPGGNYGYPFREGSLVSPGLFNQPGPGSSFNPIPPALELTHDVGGDLTLRSRAIIYGLVYRGTRFPALVGRHIFADHNYHRLWAATRNPGGALAVEYLGSLGYFTSSFGEDPRNGDILQVRYLYGTPSPIFRLVAAEPGQVENVIPQRLSETGLFADLNTLTPSPGLLPYEINVPFWSDRALKRRWFYTPSTNTTFAVRPGDLLDFPAGSVWVKHFDLPLDGDDPQSAVRLETRVLVRTDAGVYGVSYRYGGVNNDAEIVPDYGLVENFVIQYGGNTVTQKWHYPSRSDCLFCHNSAAGFAIGFQPPQLNRDVPLAGGGQVNQLAWLGEHGFLDDPSRCRPTVARLAAPSETAVSLEHRARSVLHANCATCHRPGGPTTAAMDLRVTAPLDHAGILNVPSASSNAGLDLVEPGFPDLSHLVTRMSTPAAEIRMPPVGSTLIDTNGVEVVRQWIASLAGYESYETWASNRWATVSDPLAQRQANPDGDGASNFEEYIARTDPLAADTPSRLRTLPGPLLEWTRAAGVRSVLEQSDSLAPDAPWHAVDVPGNTPTPPTVNTLVELTPEVGDGPRYFRVRTDPR